MRISLLKAGVAAAAILIIPANAFAACATSSTTAQVQSDSASSSGTGSQVSTTTSAGAQSSAEVVEEIVDNAKVDPETGDVEASTGGAKPTETWMGCPPDNDEPRCKTPEGQAQLRQEAEAKAAATGSGEDGSIDAQTAMKAQASASMDDSCTENKSAG